MKFILINIFVLIFFTGCSKKFTEDEYNEMSIMELLNEINDNTSAALEYDECVNNGPKLFDILPSYERLLDDKIALKRKIDKLKKPQIKYIKEIFITLFEEKKYYALGVFACSFYGRKHRKEVTHFLLDLVMKSDNIIAKRNLLWALRLCFIEYSTVEQKYLEDEDKCLIDRLKKLKRITTDKRTLQIIERNIYSHSKRKGLK